MSRGAGVTLALAAVAVAGGLLVLADEAQALDVSQDISVPTRWTINDSPVTVLQPIRVIGGATLTIDPGVVVQFRPDARIQFSDRWTAGTLNAAGTAELPILFKSAAGAKDWIGLYFYGIDTTMQANLQNVTIENVRGNGIYVLQWRNILFSDFHVRDTTAQGVSLESSTVTWRAGSVLRAGGHGVYVRGSTLNARDVLVDDSGRTGVFLESDARATVTRFTISDSRERPLRGNVADDLSTVTFSGNGVQQIELWGNTLTRDLRLRRIVDATTGETLPYAVLSGIAVRGGATLALDAGVTLGFRAGSITLNTGRQCCWVQENGRILAEGTADLPVRLTSDDGSRSWGGIYLPQPLDGSLPTILANTTVEHVSGDAIRVESSARVILRDSVVRDASGHGASVSSAYLVAERSRFEDNGGFGVIGDSGSTPVLRDVTFSGNVWPVRARIGSSTSGLAFEGNDFGEVQLWGGTITANHTLPNHVDAASGAPLTTRVLSTVAVENGATLTILPGATLAFDANAGMNVGRYYCAWRDCSPGAYDAGGLVAVGTPAEPITITSSNGLRSWGTILVDGRHTPAENRLPVRLEHVVLTKSAGTALHVLAHADTVLANVSLTGNAGDGVHFEDAAGAIVDSDVTGNSGVGVRLTRSSPAVLRNGVSANGWGVVADGSSNPDLRENVLDGNARPLRVTWTTSWRDNTLRGSTHPVIELWGRTFTADASLDPYADADGVEHSFAFVSSVLVINRATFTVAPGIEVDLRGNELRGGTNGWQGTCAAYCGSLELRGTEANPIVVRGGRVLVDNLHSGSWPQVVENVTIRDAPDMGLYVHYVTAGTFKNLRIENNARGIHQVVSSGIVYENVDFVANRGNAVDLHSGGSATVRDSRFVDTRGHGVYTSGVHVTLLDNVFTNTGGYAVHVVPGTGAHVARNVIDGTSGKPLRVPLEASLFTNSVANAGVREIEISGGTLNEDLTLVPAPYADGLTYTYRFVATPVVAGGATLTVAPGQSLVFEPNVELRVGVPSSAGALVAEGTPEAPIVFTSLTTWYGIFLDGTAAPEEPSRLANVVVQRVNSGYGGLRVENYDDLVVSDAEVTDNTNAHGIWARGGAFTVRDSVLANNSGHGIALAGSTTPRIERNVMRDNQFGLWASGSDTPVLVDNVFASNSARGVAASIRTDFLRNRFEENALPEVGITGGDLTAANRLYRLTDNATGDVLTYVVTENVRVWGDGALTVDPGVTLRFTQGRNLQVGWYDRWNPVGLAGVLHARGTEDAPIAFTSYRGPSEWDGLYFDGRVGGGARVSALENVTIDRASQAVRLYSHSGLRLTDAALRDHAGTALYMEAASPVLTRVDVLRSGGHGADVRGGSPVFRGVTFADSNGFGLVADESAVVTLEGSTVARSADRPLRLSARSVIGGDNRLDGNRYPEIELLGSPSGTSYPVSADRTLPRLVDEATGEAAPYVVRNRLEVYGGTLTVEPGVTVRFEQAFLYDWRGNPNGFHDWLQVGSGTTGGALVARGTEALPIVFTSDSTGRTWGGVRIDGRGAPGESVLENVTIEKSRWEGLHAYRAPLLTVADSVVRDNGYSGARLVESAATVRDSLVAANAQHGLVSESGAARLVGNVLDANALGGVLVTGTSASTPEVRGNLFRGNAQAGLLAANAAAPVVADNRFQGEGRAIGVSNLATPLDIVGGDAGEAGILDGRFQPKNGGTNWFYLTPEAYGPRHMTLHYEGPAGSSMDTVLRDRYPLAGFEVGVFATDDGRSVQDLLVQSDAEGNLAFNILIDGGRRAEIDVVPEIAPAFTWGPALPTVETPVTFTDLTTVLYGDIVLREWDFGDGNTSTEDSPTHRYDRKRAYIVSLTVTLDTGVKEYIEKPLEVVNAAPHAVFSWDVQRPAEVEALVESRATVADDILFTDESYDVDGFVVEQFRSWDFGDGTTATSATPIHRYEWPGHYNVCLTVGDDDLAIVTECRVVRVWSPKSLSEAEGAERYAAASAEVAAAAGRVEETLARANETGDAVVAAATALAESKPAELEAAAGAAVANATAAVEAVLADADAVAVDLSGAADRYRACVEAAAPTPEAPRVSPLAACATELLLEASSRIEAAGEAPASPEVLP